MILAIVLAIAATLAPAVHAQVFDGPGLYGGLDWASMIAGPSLDDPVSLVLHILLFVLSFLSLAAVIVIIIAGIRLIVSQGEDEQKEKAKKTILYAIIGLIVVLISRLLVVLILDIFWSV